GQLKISPHRLEPDRPDIFHCLTVLIETTEFEARLSRGVRRRHPAAHMRVNLPIEMKSQFILDLRTDLTPSREATQVRPRSFEHVSPPSIPVSSTRRIAARWHVRPPNGGARHGSACRRGAAVVLRRDHLGFKVASELETMERWVERALAGLQPVAGDLADAV